MLKVKEGKDQDSMQSSTTPLPETPYGKEKKHKETSHTREPRGQPFLAGEHKAAGNRQDSITKTNMKHTLNKIHHCHFSKIVSEYNQEIPQSQTADKSMAPTGRATQQPRDTRKTN